MESIAHLIGARKLATKIRRNTRAVGVFAYRPAIVFSRRRIVVSRPDITNSENRITYPIRPGLRQHLQAHGHRIANNDPFRPTSVDLKNDG